MQHAQIEEQQQRDQREEAEPEPDHRASLEPCLALGQLARKGS